jgi:hypothetical protein
MLSASGKAVRNLRATTGITAGLYTEGFITTTGPVHITSTLVAGLPRLWHRFSTANFGNFSSVASRVLPINHRTYNNNEVFKYSLITIIKEVAV